MDKLFIALKFAAISIVKLKLQDNLSQLKRRTEIANTVRVPAMRDIAAMSIKDYIRKSGKTSRLQNPSLSANPRKSS